MNLFRIQIPATSANLGLGFDSIGLALPLYLQVEVMEERDEWFIIHELGDDIPHDERNMMIQIAKKIFPSISPYLIKMTSDIPIARGLGSSSSVVVAGIELANLLGELHLTNEEKINIAAKIEGHPDNVAPAIMGNMVVAVTNEGETSYICHEFPDCDIVLVIPSEILLTEVSRNVLPNMLSHKEAILGSAFANVFLMALITENWEVVEQVMEKDLFHERYRMKLTPYVQLVREVGKKHGAYGTVLSGAGPSVLMLAPKGKGSFICNDVQENFSDIAVYCVEAEKKGAVVVF